MRHTLFGTVLNSALYTWSQTKLLDFKILKYIYIYIYSTKGFKKMNEAQVLPYFDYSVLL